MRLIDADRLKANIHANTPAAFQGMVPGINYIIDRQETIEPDADRWIPVTERLPEEKINHNTHDWERVLCSTTFGDVRAYAFGTRTGMKGPHFWNGPGCVDKYVVAWQYMPEPYREGEQCPTAEP